MCFDYTDYFSEEPTQSPDRGGSHLTPLGGGNRITSDRGDPYCLELLSRDDSLNEIVYTRLNGLTLILIYSKLFDYYSAVNSSEEVHISGTLDLILAEMEAVSK